MIDEFTALIPSSVLEKSGAAFYSGRAAFSTRSSLYILGLNPGGSPQVQANDTVEKHTEKVLNGRHEWSEYQDEAWLDGYEPGRSGMQPRVVRLLERLGLDPQKTPASNVVFVRSARERDIASTFDEVAELCWPFHRAVISRLGVRVVLCFGKRAGNFVCKKLNATNYLDAFIEDNKRRWCSRAYKNSDGIAVVVATHPSRADWTNPKSDPSELLRGTLQS
jgi:hypothetical protein